jgi:hypothetical protein
VPHGPSAIHLRELGILTLPETHSKPVFNIVWDGARFPAGPGHDFFKSFNTTPGTAHVKTDLQHSIPEFPSEKPKYVVAFSNAHNLLNPTHPIVVSIVIVTVIITVHDVIP